MWSSSSSYQAKTQRENRFKKLDKRSHALQYHELKAIDTSPSTFINDNTISINKLERFKFPLHDIEPTNCYKDTRSEIEIFQDILKILGRKVKACDLGLYEQLLQRSPINMGMSENGIVKSTAELKAEI